MPNISNPKQTLYKTVKSMTLEIKHSTSWNEPR